MVVSLHSALQSKIASAQFAMGGKSPALPSQVVVASAPNTTSPWVDSPESGGVFPGFEDDGDDTSSQSKSWWQRPAIVVPGTLAIATAGVIGAERFFGHVYNQRFDYALTQDWANELMDTAPLSKEKLAEVYNRAWKYFLNPESIPIPDFYLDLHQTEEQREAGIKALRRTIKNYCAMLITGHLPAFYYDLDGHLLFKRADFVSATGAVNHNQDIAQILEMIFFQHKMKAFVATLYGLTPQELDKLGAFTALTMRAGIVAGNSTMRQFATPGTGSGVLTGGSIDAFQTELLIGTDPTHPVLKAISYAGFGGAVQVTNGGVVQFNPTRKMFENVRNVIHYMQEGIVNDAGRNRLDYLDTLVPMPSHNLLRELKEAQYEYDRLRDTGASSGAVQAQLNRLNGLKRQKAAYDNLSNSERNDQWDKYKKEVAKHFDPNSTEPYIGIFNLYAHWVRAMGSGVLEPKGLPKIYFDNKDFTHIEYVKLSDVLRTAMRSDHKYVKDEYGQPIYVQGKGYIKNAYYDPSWREKLLNELTPDTVNEPGKVPIQAEYYQKLLNGSYSNATELFRESCEMQILMITTHAIDANGAAIIPGGNDPIFQGISPEFDEKGRPINHPLSAHKKAFSDGYKRGHISGIYARYAANPEIQQWLANAEHHFADRSNIPEHLRETFKYMTFNDGYKYLMYFNDDAIRIGDKSQQEILNEIKMYIAVQEVPAKLRDWANLPDKEKERLLGIFGVSSFRHWETFTWEEKGRILKAYADTIDNDDPRVQTLILERIADNGNQAPYIEAGANVEKQIYNETFFNWGVNRKLILQLEQMLIDGTVNEEDIDWKQYKFVIAVGGGDSQGTDLRFIFEALQLAEQTPHVMGARMRFVARRLYEMEMIDASRRNEIIEFSRDHNLLMELVESSVLGNVARGQIDLMNDTAAKNVIKVAVANPELRWGLERVGSTMIDGKEEPTYKLTGYGWSQRDQVFDRATLYGIIRAEAIPWFDERISRSYEMHHNGAKHAVLARLLMGKDPDKIDPVKLAEHLVGKENLEMNRYGADLLMPLHKWHQEVDNILRIQYPKNNKETVASFTKYLPYIGGTAAIAGGAVMVGAVIAQVANRMYEAQKMYDDDDHPIDLDAHADAFAGFGDDDIDNDPVLLAEMNGVMGLNSQPSNNVSIREPGLTSLNSAPTKTSFSSAKSEKNTLKTSQVLQAAPSDNNDMPDVEQADEPILGDLGDIFDEMDGDTSESDTPMSQANSDRAQMFQNLARGANAFIWASFGIFTLIDTVLWPFRIAGVAAGIASSFMDDSIFQRMLGIGALPLWLLGQSHRESLMGGSYIDDFKDKKDVEQFKKEFDYLKGYAPGNRMPTDPKALDAWFTNQMVKRQLQFENAMPSIIPDSVGRVAARTVAGLGWNVDMLKATIHDPTILKLFDKTSATNGVPYKTPHQMSALTNLVAILSLGMVGGYGLIEKARDYINEHHTLEDEEVHEKWDHFLGRFASVVYFLSALPPALLNVLAGALFIRPNAQAFRLLWMFENTTGEASMLMRYNPQQIGTLLAGAATGHSLTTVGLAANAVICEDFDTSDAVDTSDYTATAKGISGIFAGVVIIALAFFNKFADSLGTVRMRLNTGWGNVLPQWMLDRMPIWLSKNFEEMRAGGFMGDPTKHIQQQVYHESTNRRSLQFVKAARA